MRDPLHRLSVKAKLSLLFAGLCLLAFGVGGTLVSWSARVALEDAIQARIETRCAMLARSLDDQLRLLARRADDFASDGYIRERVEEIQALPDDAPERQETIERLELHLARNKLPLAQAFTGLAIVAADGRALAVAGQVDPSLAALPSLTAAAHGPLLADEAAAVQWIATPIRSLDGSRTLGRLAVRVDTWTWISGAVAPAASSDGVPGLGDEARLRVETPDGVRVVATPSSEGRGLEPGLEIETARVSTAAPGEGLFSRSYPVTENGWTVHVRVPSLEAYAPIAGLQSRFLGVGVLLALLTGVLLFFPMRFLVRPLGVLRDAARRIREGDYTVRVPVQSTDEVGELARAFNHMASAVQDQTRELQDAADEVRHREAELRVERDRLDTVIRSLRDGLLVLDGEGRAVLSNAAAAPLVEMLRRRADALSSHYACGEAETVTSCAACLVQPEAPSRMCVLDVEGRVYEVHAAALPPDADGARGRVLVARDISDRVQRDEREIHQERLSVLGEVAAVLAHELNNPLTSIRMFAQMMESELPDDDPHREHVDVVLRNTEVCRRAIRELLGYANDSAPQAAEVDVTEVLADVARFVRPLAERAGARVVLDEGAAGTRLVADEIQLRQLFVNLLVNAVQAADGPGVEIRVSPSRVGEALHVDVIDTGPGMPDELQPRIFDAFVSSKPRGEGTGLGLPTSRRIAELHGGGLDLVESKPGRTHFRVRLLARADTGAPRPEELV